MHIARDISNKSILKRGNNEHLNVALLSEHKIRNFEFWLQRRPNFHISVRIGGKLHLLTNWDFLYKEMM